MPSFFAGPGIESLPRGFATDSFGDFAGWMAVGILIIFIVGMLAYLYAITRQRDRQRAMMRARRAPEAQGFGGRQEYVQYGPRYPEDGQEDIPDAVRAAYQDIRRDPVGRGDPGEGAWGHDEGAGMEFWEDAPRRRPAQDFSYREPAEAPAGRPRASTGTPRSAPGAGRHYDALEELLATRRPGDEPVRLEAEDRQLLWEEAQEREAPASEEAEEVLFIDDDGEAEGQGDEAAGGEVDVPQKEDFVSGPLALLLLQKDIEKAVRAKPGAPRTATGPAWSEGRPVFSKPLEEPTAVPSAAAARPPPLDIDDFTVQLRSLAEKKRGESRRLEDERKSREQRRAAEDAARKEESLKKEQAIRQGIRGMVRAAAPQAQPARAAEAQQAPPEERSEAERAEDERRLEEQRRKEERRKRWLEVQKKHEVETIEDVLSRIGIK